MYFQPYIAFSLFRNPPLTVVVKSNLLLYPIVTNWEHSSQGTKRWSPIRVASAGGSLNWIRRSQHRKCSCSRMEMISSYGCLALCWQHNHWSPPFGQQPKRRAFFMESKEKQNYWYHKVNNVKIPVSHEVFLAIDTHSAYSIYRKKRRSLQYEHIFRLHRWLLKMQCSSGRTFSVNWYWRNQSNPYCWYIQFSGRLSVM